MSFAKSKAFKDREQNARERLRQVAKQDLVADLGRLFGDTTFSDVLFMVKNVEFQAHTVVLRVRAPSFCRRFLPNHASPVSVQTCIQINGLEVAEFESFLRSVYTDDDFKDYNESSYPWIKQKTTVSEQLNHVTCKNEETEVNSFSQTGVCTQFGCMITHNGAKEDPSVKNFVEQVDITSTQLECTETSIKDGIVSDDKKVGSPVSSGSGDNFFPLQCISSCETTMNVNHFNLDSGSSSLILSCNNTEDSAVSVEASLLQVTDTNQCCKDLVDHVGQIDQTNLDFKLACTSSNQDIKNACSTPLCNGSLVKRENIVQDKEEITENGFQSRQGHLGLELNHIAPREISKRDINVECCNIGQDLLQLLISGAGSDVTFVVNGGKVKAHKAILCARSNYFSAMLHGNWVEGETSEIPLIGVNYDGFMTVLKYMYGGTTYIGSDLAVICDTLPLVDMYNLNGLKEIIICNLKIEKCHLFHKPCGECITGISECLEVSELFSLTELKKSCIKWMAKHFDRVLGTKGFTTLPKHLQEELLLEIQGGFVVSSAIEVLNHCDRISSCTLLVKWTEPIHVAVSSIQESCLLFLSRNFFSLVDETSFHEILRGVGWSIPVLEKIFSAVKKHFAIDNCCDQLRAILKLKRLLQLRNTEEDKESYPEEVEDLIERLHSDCMKFIRCNLFKVTRSEGWRKLKPPTQRDIKEGAVFSGLTDAGSRRGAEKDTNRRSSTPPSSRPAATKPSQRVGLDSRARGVGRGSTATNPQRPYSARVDKGAAGGLAPINKRPSSAQSASSQSSTTLDRGKVSSGSKGASEKRLSSSRTSVAFGSSFKSSSSSFSQNLLTDKRPPSGRTSTAPGRGKMLSSSIPSNQKLSSRSSGQRESLPTWTSNAKNSSSLQQKKSNERPSSAANFSGSRKSQTVSKPTVSTVSSNSSFSKSLSKGKCLSLEVAGNEIEKASTKFKDQTLSNSRQCRGQVNKLASNKSNESLQSTDFEQLGSKEKLLHDRKQDLSSTTQSSEDAEKSIVSSELSENRHSFKLNGNEPRTMHQNCNNGNASTSSSERSRDTRATGSLAEESFAESASKKNPGDNLLPINDGTVGLSSNSPCIDDSPSQKFSDSLELD